MRVEGKRGLNLGVTTVLFCFCFVSALFVFYHNVFIVQRLVKFIAQYAPNTFSVLILNVTSIAHQWNSREARKIKAASLVYYSMDSSHFQKNFKQFTERSPIVTASEVQRLAHNSC